jgi:integrase
VTEELIQAYIEKKLAAGVSPSTLRVHVALLSMLYRSMKAKANPARGLSDETLALLRPTHDPQDTPYLQDPRDIRRIYLKLAERNEGVAIAFALCSMAGLRTGEAFALRWASVDLTGRRVTIRESVKARRRTRRRASSLSRRRSTPSRRPGSSGAGEKRPRVSSSRHGGATRSTSTSTSRGGRSAGH